MIGQIDPILPPQEDPLLKLMKMSTARVESRSNKLEGFLNEVESVFDDIEKFEKMEKGDRHDYRVKKFNSRLR